MTGPAPQMRRAVVLFTRDLRLHDNPVLDLACRLAAEVIPVFVFDSALPLASPNRAAFLLGVYPKPLAGLTSHPT